MEKAVKEPTNSNTCICFSAIHFICAKADSSIVRKLSCRHRSHHLFRRCPFERQFLATLTVRWSHRFMVMEEINLYCAMYVLLSCNFKVVIQFFRAMADISTVSISSKPESNNALYQAIIFNNINWKMRIRVAIAEYKMYIVTHHRFFSG